MGVHRYGLPLAVLATAVSAGAATLILLPRPGPLEPTAVELTAYFSGEEIDRARGYRAPARALALANAGVAAGTLALLALRPPARVRRTLERARARPLAGGAAAGAALYVALATTTLPLEAVAHARAVEVGLSTQGFGQWLGDVAKSTGLGVLMAGGGGALAMALTRRFPRRWWAPSAVVIVGVGAALLFVSPVLIEPLFNRFEPLPNGPLRGQVLGLAERAGVDVGEVYRVDASRRTSGANAYVGGLAKTKRVVLYDNLIDDFPPEEVRSVVAHELAHVRFGDVWRGLAWLAMVAPAGAFCVQRLTERLVASVRTGERRGLPGRGPPAPAGPAMLPALALSVALVSFGLGAASNLLSRRVEARADEYALELTREPRAAIGLARRLTTQNVADPDPPAVLHVLFSTHPTALERVGAALAWERGR